jgi:hypothetical protein
MPRRAGKRNIFSGGFDPAHGAPALPALKFFLNKNKIAQVFARFFYVLI